MSIDKGIVSLLLLATIGQVASAIFIPSLPIIAETLQVSPAIIQRLASIYIVVYALAHLIGGYICDSFGRRKILLFSSLLTIIGGLLTVFGSLQFLYWGRVFQALGFGLAAIVTKAMMRDQYSGRKYAVIISYFLNVSLIAPAVAPLLGAWLTSTWGWLAQFVFIAVSTVFTAVLVIIFLNEDCYKQKGNKKILEHLLPVIRDRRCMVLSFASGIIYGSDIAIEIMAPFFLKREYGADTKECAYFFAISLIFILIGSSLIRFLNIDLEKIVQYGASILLTSSLILSLSTNIFVVVLAISFYLLACGMLYSTISSIALLPHTSTAGMAASISGGIHMTVAGAGSMLATYLTPNLFSLRLLLPLTSIMVFFITIAFVKTDKNKIRLQEG